MEVAKWTLLSIIIGALIVLVVSIFGGIARSGTDAFSEMSDYNAAPINSTTPDDSITKSLFTYMFTAELGSAPRVWSMVLDFMLLIGALFMMFFAWRLARAVLG